MIVEAVTGIAEKHGIAEYDVVLEVNGRNPHGKDVADGRKITLLLLKEGFMRWGNYAPRQRAGGEVQWVEARKRYGWKADEEGEYKKPLQSDGRVSENWELEWEDILAREEEE